MIHDRNRNLSAYAVDRKAVKMARTEDDHERMVRGSLYTQHLSAELKGCLSATSEFGLQATFHRRKNGLMRRAMELSVLCGCDIAMFLFGPDDKLAQYTSSEMEGLLDRYSRTCQQPHETRNNQDVSLDTCHYTANAAHQNCNIIMAIPGCLR